MNSAIAGTVSFFVDKISQSVCVDAYLYVRIFALEEPARNNKIVKSAKRLAVAAERDLGEAREVKAFNCRSDFFLRGVGLVPKGVRRAESVRV